jgi:hypothetical protein
MIAGHAASPTTSPLCSRKPAILGDTSIRRSVDLAASRVLRGESIRSIAVLAG